MANQLGYWEKTVDRKPISFIISADWQRNSWFLCCRIVATLFCIVFFVYPITFSAWGVLILLYRAIDFELQWSFHTDLVWKLWLKHFGLCSPCIFQNPQRFQVLRFFFKTRVRCVSFVSRLFLSLSFCK